MLRTTLIIAALLLAAPACAGTNPGYFPMPGPRDGGYDVTVWNEGLGVLHVQIVNAGDGAAEGGRYTIMQGDYRTVRLDRRSGSYRVRYEIGGQTYLTVVSFVPRPDHPCWGMVVDAAPRLNVVNPLPMACR